MYKHKEPKRVKINDQVLLALKSQLDHATLNGRTTDSLAGLVDALLAIIQTHHIDLTEAQKVCRKVGYYINDETLHKWIRPVPDQVQFNTSANNNNIKKSNTFAAAHWYPANKNKIAPETDISDLRPRDFIDDLVDGADLKQFIKPVVSKINKVL